MAVYKLYKPVDYFPGEKILEEYTNDYKEVLENITPKVTLSVLHKMFYKKLTKKWQYQTADYMLFHAFKLYNSVKKKPEIHKKFLYVPLKYVYKDGVLQPFHKSLKPEKVDFGVENPIRLDCNESGCRVYYFPVLKPTDVFIPVDINDGYLTFAIIKDDNILVTANGTVEDVISAAKKFNGTVIEEYMNINGYSKIQKRLSKLCIDNKIPHFSVPPFFNSSICPFCGKKLKVITHKILYCETHGYLDRDKVALFNIYKKFKKRMNL